MKFSSNSCQIKSTFLNLKILQKCLVDFFKTCLNDILGIFLMVSTKILIHGHPPPLRTGFARAVESLADRQLKYAPQGSIPPQSERRRSLYTGSDIRCSDYYSMTIHLALLPGINRWKWIGPREWSNKERRQLLLYLPLIIRLCCLYRQVEETDGGQFECQVSSLPVISFFITLNVVGMYESHLKGRSHDNFDVLFLLW